MEVSTWPHALNSDVPAFSRRYAIPPEHGKRLERLAIGRCPGPPGAGWAAGWQPHPPRLPAVVWVSVSHTVSPSFPLGQAVVPQLWVCRLTQAARMCASTLSFSRLLARSLGCDPRLCRLEAASVLDPHPPAPGPPSRTPLSLQSLCSVLNMRSSVRRSSQCCTAEWGPWGRLLSVQDWITRAPSANVPLSGLRP